MMIIKNILGRVNLHHRNEKTSMNTGNDILQIRISVYVRLEKRSLIVNVALHKWNY